MDDEFYKEFGIKLIELSQLESSILQEIKEYLRQNEALKFHDHLIALNEIIERYSKAPILTSEISTKMKGHYGSDE